MPRIFISYRREDTSGYAGRLFDRLEERFGKSSVFMDIDSLAPGVDFAEVIDSSVSTSDVLLAVIGRNWLSAKDGRGRTRLENPNDFVRLEISAALKRGIRVIPVLVAGAQMPRSQELPRELAELARRQAFIVHDDAFRPRIDWLIRNIEEIASAVRKPEGEPSEAAPKEEQEPAGSDAASMIQSKLQATAELLDVSVSPERRRETRVQGQPDLWVRRWLLLYKPVRRWAWIPRLVFYYLAFAGIVALPILIVQAITEKTGDRAEDFAISLITFLSFQVLALPFRVLSRMIEGPRPFVFSDLVLARKPS